MKNQAILSPSKNGDARRNAGMPTSYLNFDLMFHPTKEKNKYSVHVISSPAGQAETAVDLIQFATATAWQRLESPFSQGAPNANSNSVANELAIKNFGGDLFKAIFDNAVFTCLQESQKLAAQTHAGLRLRLDLKDAPELAVLPWEYMYDARNNRFLACSIETSIVRHLNPEKQAHPSSPLNLPLRILVMVSSPLDLPRLNAKGEWNKLTKAFRELEEKGLAKLERLEKATLEALHKKLLDGEPYHIFHFIGHGEFDPEMQDGTLIFEDEDEQSKPVKGETLGQLLHNHPSMRFAILNACEGGRSAENDLFSGVAQSFVQQGLPAVIAMQYPISDEAATTLSRWFYETLAKGHTIDAALTQARYAISLQDHQIEWGTPVLYMRESDGQIFDIESASPPALVVRSEEGTNGTPRPKTPCSIAVLPLESFSNDVEQEYFANGMMQDLITDLWAIDTLRVVSRTSVMPYKNAAKSLPQIARELRVDTVLAGSVQRAGERIRITAQLIEAATDRLVWAKRYERTLQDLFKVQTDVAQDIVNEVKTKLRPRPETSLSDTAFMNARLLLKSLIKPKADSKVWRDDN